MLGAAGVAVSRTAAEVKASCTAADVSRPAAGAEPPRAAAVAGVSGAGAWGEETLLVPEDAEIPLTADRLLRGEGVSR